MCVVYCPAGLWVVASQPRLGLGPDLTVVSGLSGNFYKKKL